MKLINLSLVKQALHQPLVEKLGLQSFPTPEAFIADLGHDPVAGDKFFNATLQRIQIWSGEAWVILGSN